MSSEPLKYWLAVEPEDHYNRCFTPGRVIIFGAGLELGMCLSLNALYQLSKSNDIYLDNGIFYDLYIPELIEPAIDQNLHMIQNPSFFKPYSFHEEYLEAFKRECRYELEPLFPSEDREDMLKRRKLYNRQQTAKFNSIAKQCKKSNRPQKKLQSNKKKS